MLAARELRVKTDGAVAVGVDAARPARPPKVEAPAPEPAVEVKEAPKPAPAKACCVVC